MTNDDYKNSVRAATTANVTLSGLQTIDGVSLGNADRVLVKDQASAEGNGLYQVRSGAWNRASDGNNRNTLTSGATAYVSEGSVNEKKMFYLTTLDPIVIDTTPQTWEVISSTFSASDPHTWTDDNDFTNQVLLHKGAQINLPNSAYPGIGLRNAGGGDVDNRLQVNGDGIIRLGDGTNPLDTELYRRGADALATPGSFTLEGEVPYADESKGLLFKNAADASVAHFYIRNDDDTHLQIDGQSWRFNDRGRFTGGLTTSAGIWFSPSDADAGVNLFSAGGAIHSTAPFIAVEGVTTKTKPGVPNDGDFAVTPLDGTIVIDTVTPAIYVRVGGSWLATAPLT